jgi:hypothetical protein
MKKAPALPGAFLGSADCRDQVVGGAYFTVQP